MFSSHQAQKLRLLILIFWSLNEQIIFFSCFFENWPAIYIFHMSLRRQRSLTLPEKSMPTLTPQQQLDSKAFAEMARLHIAPLAWKNPNKEEFPVKSGTIFFCNTGEKIIGITAYHVYEGYINAKRIYPKLSCSIHNAKFKLEEKIIGYHPELDIATFNFTKAEITSLIKVDIFYGSEAKWPPQTPKENESVFFAGFPGQDRERRGNNVIFSPYFASCSINTIDEKKIVCGLGWIVCKWLKSKE